MIPDVRMRRCRRLSDVRPRHVGPKALLHFGLSHDGVAAPKCPCCATGQDASVEPKEVRCSVGRCRGGPLDGETVYVAAALGCTVTVALPPSAEGGVFVYEVDHLGDDSNSPSLRFVAQEQ